MIIYDYFEDNPLLTVIFILITIICLVILLLLIINSIHAIKKMGITVINFALLIAIIVALVLFCFVSYRTFMIIKFHFTCISENYESVLGPIEIVSCTQNDYRDMELYDVEFKINGMYFKPVNSFSIEQKTLLTTNLDKDIEIRYSYIGKELVIYQIVIYKNE